MAGLSGFDRGGVAARLSVPAAIRWQIIQWAKASGYQWLDFGGLRPETLDVLLNDALNDTGRDVEHLPTGDQPKVTFGGTAYRYPTPVELIRPAPLRMGYDLARRSAAGQRMSAAAKSMLRGSRRAP